MEDIKRITIDIPASMNKELENIRKAKAVKKTKRACVIEALAAYIKKEQRKLK